MCGGSGAARHHEKWDPILGSKSKLMQMYFIIFDKFEADFPSHLSTPPKTKCHLKPPKMLNISRYDWMSRTQESECLILGRDNLRPIPKKTKSQMNKPNLANSYH